MDTPHQQSPYIAEESDLYPIHSLNRAQWQLRILPFMTWFVALVSVILLAVSISDMVLVRRDIQSPDVTTIRALMERTLPENAVNSNPNQQITRSLLLLEADALDKRYHQANALLMSRIWTKHLAFITGEIMALLGAVFILGKLKEDPAKIGGGATGWRVDIASTSPGIVLACFGTILLIVAVTSQTRITVTDHPVYIAPHVLPGATVAGNKTETVTPPNTEIITESKSKH